MLSDMLKFMIDRFYPPVTIPFTFVLVAVASEFSELGKNEFLLTWISTFFFIFILRAADDLTDIDLDKIGHPERRLVSGEIRQQKLKKSLYLIGGILICLNFSQPAALVLIGLTFLYTFVFYYRDAIPALIRIPLMNIIFLFLPVYVGFTGSSPTWIPLILLGLFIWLSTIAHDISHSIHEIPREGDYARHSLKTVNPQIVALVSTFIFLIAAGVGFLFWWYIGQPLYFIILLGSTLIQILYLSKKLIQNPDFSTAKPFYVYGFTFFLVPLSGMTVTHFLKLF